MKWYDVTYPETFEEAATEFDLGPQRMMALVDDMLSAVVWRWDAVKGEHAPTEQPDYKARPPQAGYRDERSPGDAQDKHFRIDWQNGPVDRENGERANGAFVEDVIEVARRRLEFYQECDAACRENDDAIYHLNAAIDVLVQRRDGCQARGVQGTDKP